MLRFYKGQPTDYIIKYSGGKESGRGTGLSFFYWPYNTHVVAVPTSSRDVNFVFTEVTGNFQNVAIQGQCTYRITNANTAAALLNFTLDPIHGKYVSDDPDHLPQRITNIIQKETRGEIQGRTLERTLTESESIASAVFDRVRAGVDLQAVGVELLSVYFVAVKPTPEVAKALEAEHRETLLRKADEAIYARRAAAVEEERKIKENELRTDITLEEQRERLIELNGNNTLQEAEFRGKAVVMEGESRTKALTMELDAYAGQDPKLLLALAMRNLGDNAGKVGNLTITTELMASLLGANGK